MKFTQYTFFSQEPLLDPSIYPSICLYCPGQVASVAYSAKMPRCFPLLLLLGDHEAFWKQSGYSALSVCSCRLLKSPHKRTCQAYLPTDTFKIKVQFNSSLGCLSFSTVTSLQVYSDNPQEVATLLPSGLVRDLNPGPLAP